MAYQFTKLFQQILESTVWCEPDAVRVVWITMLASCDRNGLVLASVPGLAKRANVDVEVTRDALNRFMSPDPDSRTKEHEGRRIQEVDGGWLLLNHGKYAKIIAHEQEKERKRRWWHDNRGKGGGAPHPPAEPPDEH